MKVGLVLLAASVFCMSCVAFASDDLKALEGKVVVAAGDVTALECPYGGAYDCATWPMGLLRFDYKDVCFTSDLGACGSYCKGFIAVGKDQVPYFFEVGGLGDRIKKRGANYYLCPEVD